MAGGKGVFVDPTFGLLATCLINGTSVATFPCSPLGMAQKEKQTNK